MRVKRVCARFNTFYTEGNTRTLACPCRWGAEGGGEGGRGGRGQARTRRGGGGGGGVGEQRGSVVVVREEVLEGDLVALNLFGTSDVAVAVSVPDIAGHLGNCALARPLSIVVANPICMPVTMVSGASTVAPSKSMLP